MIVADSVRRHFGAGAGIEIDDGTAAAVAAAMRVACSQPDPYEMMVHFARKCPWPRTQR